MKVEKFWFRGTVTKMKYFGKLGGGTAESERPVLLFNDNSCTYQEFDKLGEAVKAREQQSLKDKWAALKMIFIFDIARLEYQRLA